MTPSRRRLSLLTAAVSLSLVLSSCSLLGGTANRSLSPAKTESAATGSPSSSPSSTSTTTDGGFAEFDLSQHALFPDLGSPDRLTSITSNAKPEGFVDAPPGQGLQRYADQKITWKKCGGGECAAVIVPLNWDEPDGQAITLKMLRQTGSGTHAGSLFVNPGGPGGSGARCGSHRPGTPRSPRWA